MESDNYSSTWKEAAYQVCDLIRTKELSPADSVKFFEEEMKKKFTEISQSELDHLFSYGMFVTR